MYLDFFSVFFSVFLLINAVMVILTNNSVYSIFFLILTFIFATGLLCVLECEFIAFIFLVLYVGAVAVLFLFVIMMLNIKITNSFKDLLKFFPITNLIGIIFFLILFLTLLTNFEINPYFFSDLNNSYINWYDKIDSITDSKALGQILYTNFVFQFLIVGIILLIAILGSVILTLTNEKTKTKKQKIFKQISR
uniref:NADH-ubiquinone oxidoreductase chain 6 n=1 Tax=Melosira undulata TaxID=2133757 RepID=A0A3G1PWD5_9STRA|nr:NADH dehydrogenase subunit 6 [Melosira undulata]AVR57556.1 NADH dehydrogenase subunit 6 [Melosira undulata]